jgi:hypothetical protein
MMFLVDKLDVRDAATPTPDAAARRSGVSLSLKGNLALAGAAKTGR